jgi:hypothetical protein
VRPSLSSADRGGDIAKGAEGLELVVAAAATSPRGSGEELDGHRGDDIASEVLVPARSSRLARGVVLVAEELAGARRGRSGRSH